MKQAGLWPFIFFSQGLFGLLKLFAAQMHKHNLQENTFFDFHLVNIIVLKYNYSISLRHSRKYHAGHSKP